MKEFKKSRELKLLASAGVLMLLLAGCSLQDTNPATNQQTVTPPNQNNQNQPPTDDSNQPTQGQFDVTTTDDTALGKILVDGKKMTLYIFTKDSVGTSTCYGQCAVNWPPLLTSNLPKLSGNLKPENFGLITRNDGNQQVTYKGLPLYYWINDTKPGDTTGQNVGGVWFVQNITDDDSSGN